MITHTHSQTHQHAPSPTHTHTHPYTRTHTHALTHTHSPSLTHTHLDWSLEVWPVPAEVEEGDEGKHDLELHPQGRVLHQLRHRGDQGVTHGDDTLKTWIDCVTGRLIGWLIVCMTG